MSRMLLYGRYEKSLIVSFTETALKNSAVNIYKLSVCSPARRLQCVLAHLTSLDVIAAAQGASLTIDLAKDSLSVFHHWQKTKNKDENLCATSSPVTLIKV